MAKRSKSFPAYTLQQSIDFASELRTSLGESYISIESIEDHKGVKYDAFKQKLSSCNQYGLLEKKQRVGYKPTDLLKEILYPDNDKEKTEKRIQAFSRPPFCDFIIRKYNNEIFPVKAGLRNIVIRHYGITENSVAKSLDVLYKNIEELELLDSENRLVVPVPTFVDEVNSSFTSSIGSRDHTGSVDQNSIPKTNDKEEDKVSDERDSINKNNDFLEIPIHLDSNRSALLHVPRDLKPDELEYLKEVVEISLKRIVKKVIQSGGLNDSE
ncbi:MAG: hypothetical protein AAFR61_15055 [Bacteroidota bacterium]